MLVIIMNFNNPSACDFVGKLFKRTAEHPTAKNIPECFVEAKYLFN
jgi:hypothetical protein